MTHTLRKIGVESDYMVIDDLNGSWLMPGEPDYNLRIYHRQAKDVKKIKRDIRKFFISALLKYDVFHYHSNIPLFEDFSDLKILRLFQKKMVVSYWGCDVRQKSINIKYPYNTCQVCKIPCDESQRLTAKNIFAQYADATIAHIWELFEYSPKGTKVIPALIDTNIWKPDQIIRRKNKNFQILQAFGNSLTRGDVRGSQFLKQAVARLQKKGYKIQFSFFDSVPNHELKKYYLESDLVVEQLRYGTYGLTALEAMALGKPVVSFIRKDLIKYYPNLPLIIADPSDIEAKIEWAINNPSKLKAIGEKSRKYVVQNHDSLKVIGKILSLYKSLY